jgi:hypothetical protein
MVLLSEEHPQNLPVKASTPNMIVFGDRAFKKGIKVK